MANYNKATGALSEAHTLGRKCGGGGGDLRGWGYASLTFDGGEGGLCKLYSHAHFKEKCF